TGSHNLVEGNVIHDNGAAGVQVSDHSSGDAQGNTVSENAIYSNHLSPDNVGPGPGLGIDLLSNDSWGVTPNDSLDADSGSNGLQNFPILTAAHCGGASGTLNSVPNTTFRIEFFANHQADPSGYGEGERYVGFQNVTSDASGNVTFDAPIDTLQDGEQY